MYKVVWRLDSICSKQKNRLQFMCEWNRSNKKKPTIPNNEQQLLNKVGKMSLFYFLGYFSLLFLSDVFVYVATHLFSLRCTLSLFLRTLCQSISSSLCMAKFHHQHNVCVQASIVIDRFRTQINFRYCLSLLMLFTNQTALHTWMLNVKSINNTLPDRHHTNPY